MSQVTAFTIPASPLTMSALATTLEAAFAALGSQNRGASAPSNPFEGMLWWDSSANPEALKRYTATGGWATLLTVNITTGALSISPAGVDDSSSNAAAMQTTADPYPAGSESLATSQTGELQRVRYLIRQITGMAQWYHDPVGEFFVPAGEMIAHLTGGPASGTSETAVNKLVQDYFAFDATTKESVGFNRVMPDDWNLGTVKAKFYWLPGSSSGDPGDTVEWEISAVARSDDDAIDAEPGTAQVVSDAVLGGESADIHITAATPALTIGGTPAKGDLVYFKVSRNPDGTDDFAHDAILLGVRIQYTKGATDGAAW